MPSVLYESGRTTQPVSADAERPEAPSTFLGRITDASAAAVLSRGAVRIVGRNEVVFLQGEPGGRVAVIQDGAFKVTCAGPTGSAVLVDLRGPGDVIGLLEILTGRPRVSTVTSITPGVLRAFTSNEFDRLLGDAPDATAAAVAVVADRVRGLIESRLLSAAPVPVRLADALLRLARSHGRADPDGTVRIDLALSQDDLAMIVGASRDSVAKTLMLWRRRDMVATRRRSIVILDPVRLGDQI